MAESNQSGLWQEKVAASKDERTIWEAHVSTTMGFAEGRHRMWYDPEGHQHTKEVEDNEAFRTINLINSHLGIHQARLTANDPRWTPVKSEGENMSKDQVDAADALLQDAWEGEPLGDKSLKFISKLVIRYGFLQGRDIVYVRFDDNLQMPVVERFDLWDTFTDPSSQSLMEKEWLVIALPKGVQWLKRNKNYNKGLRDLLSADATLAESGIKSHYVQMVSGGNARARGTIMTYYTFERNDEGGITHRVIVPTQGKGDAGEGGVLLKKNLRHKGGKREMLLSDIFDSFAPHETGQFYERPIVYDWIEPQKTINKMYSNIENYIDCFVQGKWILRDEDVDIPRAGVQGQKIIGDRGDVQAIDLAPLPSTHFEHLANAQKQLEQISGVHSESFGRLSGGVESGVGIAQLQALDEQNSAAAVDNFKMFLGRVGLKVLNSASNNWTNVKKLYRFDKATGLTRELIVIGAGSKREASVPTDTTKFGPFARLDVEIVIGQFFLASQKREEIRALLDSGWTPGGNPVLDRVILDSFDIGVGREITKELEKLQNPDVMIALGKAAKIVAGEGASVPVLNSDPHAFLQKFYTGRAEEMLEEGDEEAARLLNARAQEHAIMIQQGAGGVGIPEAPGTSEGLAVENKM